MDLTRSLRLAILALLVAAPLALAACGDDEDGNEAGSDETTVASPGVTEDPGTSEPSSDGPAGELTAEGIGEIRQGASTDEVRAAFGEPDETLKGPGCELAPDSGRVLLWTYELGDGEATLFFDAPTSEFGDYRVTSPGLETSLGDTVGEPFAELRANWGGSLKGLPLGAKPTAQAGLWRVVEDEDSQLLFDVRGGKVSGISGGDIQICE
jgi:hypothetical protein